MNSYREWPEKPLSVTSLFLDPRNPRLPAGHAGTSQRNLVAQLVEFDKVYELARGIADHGFYPTEVLIGVEENGKKIIIEGNRRLAALKLLLSPEIVAGKEAKKFAALQLRTNLQDIRKVRVVLAPSREAAAPIIVNRHTGTGIEKWKPAQQGQYLHEFVGEDASLDELSKQLGVSKSDLSSILRANTMYRVACQLTLPPKVQRLVRNPREFNVSTLQRLTDSSRFSEFLNISFDPLGNFTARLAPSEFTKAYTKMVSDIALKEEDSRSLNGEIEIKRYLSGFGEETPNRRLKGAVTSDALLETNDVEIAAQDGASPTVSPKVRQRPQRGLIPPPLKCQLAEPRISKIFSELKALELKNFPNVSGIMLRVLLELLIAHYLDTTGKIAPLLAAHRAKGKPLDWYPTLRETLLAVVEDKSNPLNIHPQARKSLKAMAEEKHHLLTVDRMDQFIHNKFVTPTEDQLRQIWSTLEGLITELLVEHAATVGGG